MSNQQESAGTRPLYKVGVIGDYDSICGFAALGIDIFDVIGQEDTESTLKNLVDHGYAIIFITEPCAQRVSHLLEIYRSEQIPAVIPIPSVAGTTGFGISFVKKAVEQAVGSDIIFNEE